MGRHPGARIVTLVCSLILVGLVLRLIASVFQPVLPPELMKSLGDGWRLLYGLVAPSMPAVAAVGMVAAIFWIFGASGSKRR